MKLAFTQDEEAFRLEVRAWLTANMPTRVHAVTPTERREPALAWQRTQHLAGWAGVAWPKEYGGRGLSLIEQLIWFEEYGKAGAPPLVTDPIFVGVSHAGPTLILKGTAEQKAFHLPKILRGEALWCQGFSEPQAGSDLASLRCKGTIDGDSLIVEGQKIWTSSADIADYQELLVRTDPAAPRHRGISWVICDMKSPGITVRPIRTMDGGAEFCEVFYDRVRIPLSNVVGGLNQGWGVAMATMGFERGTAFIADAAELSVKVDALATLCLEADAAAWKPGSPQGAGRADLGRRAALLRAEVMSLRAVIYRQVSRNIDKDQPGPEGSMVRLRYSMLVKAVHQLAMEVLGDTALVRRRDEFDWVRSYFFSYSQTIAAGTEQIQRNIIGERILGLPKSAAV